MLRPFVPSKDHERSRQFYEAIGFETTYADGRIAVMSNGDDSFILQNFYMEELANNFMLQMTVPDADAWWKEHDPAHAAEQFGTRSPTPPALQPWGLIVGFLHDPSGVLWHITEAQA
ncbi:VOC family protein [Terrihabitans sp. B22-R8]|uniref:VOC family protein n=1 Tax=Terrihabitans sp. B22-R8 TaxID=3425128 RepID=UPI00403D487C